MFFFSVLCLLWLCDRLFICALWSPAGKGLTSWLSFVVSGCEFVTFPSFSLDCIDLSIPDLCTLTYFQQFRFARHSLKTPAVICYLSVNDIMGVTVFKLPRINLAFTTDWCQIVMGLQCRHEPLGHLKEEYQTVSFPSVSEWWKM